ncbi:MAG: AMP-binding protein, partial [Cyanobacteria bacterium P01_H01_bin.58]
MTATIVLQQRWKEPWILGTPNNDFWRQLTQFQAKFQAQQPQDILLVEPDPICFLAAFLAACQQPSRIWLANPQWGLQEWQQVADQCCPDAIVGQVPNAAWDDSSYSPIEKRETFPPGDEQTQIFIPTGGSSGSIRFAVHTWGTLTASVQGFQQHCQCDSVNAYCVLPVFHVSGLMQAMRCLLSGGQLVIQPWRSLLTDGPIAPPPKRLFLSLVPTQLQRLLQSDWDVAPWLRQFTAILLGGAPAWPTLLQTARDLRLPLAPTYGMTETASQVATLLPQEFLAGNTSSGRSLPHADIRIYDATGNSLPTNKTGWITIKSASLAPRYEHTALVQPFQSGDLGYLDPAGYLHVVGRGNTLIITGGEKVLPEEVEQAIVKTGLVQDVVVVGIPDEIWGEAVV